MDYEDTFPSEINLVSQSPLHSGDNHEDKHDGSLSTYTLDNDRSIPTIDDAYRANSQDNHIGDLQSSNKKIVSLFSSVKTLQALQFPDEHKNSPLVPPDEMRVLGVRHVFSNVKRARLWYKFRKKFEKTSKRTRRKYLCRSYHISMFNYTTVHIVNWELLGDVNINVTLADGTDTVIRIRMAEKPLSDAIVALHKRLKKEIPNSRRTAGDEGKMYSLGKRNSKKEFVISKRNKDIRKLMSKIGNIRKEWVKKELPNEYHVLNDSSRKLDYMSDSLSDFMVHSVALANASHYDVSDISTTICTWVEEDIGNTMNWFLVFPNVTFDKMKGIAIQLLHGITISWDAARLRHASSRVEYVDEDNGGNSGGNCETKK